MVSLLQGDVNVYDIHECTSLDSS